ncbi:hypothetical protein GCM10025876_04220 [Demequina litorisediminis]|uniref:Uncharacterized protein n=1 Tax=Demequina litorisediminis TaxID=1849022 RepID=A0ABQ6IBU7_9MICO|nr:hypothetical protein GCM10025876_04220 [Demequina litorisediminis]
MPNDTRVNPAAANWPSDSRVTESGFASVVTSASAASPQVARTPSSSATRARGSSIVGVPPPRNTVRTGRASPAIASPAIAISAKAAPT